MSTTQTKPVEQKPHTDTHGHSHGHSHDDGCGCGHEHSATVVRQGPKIGRNDKCPCGSDKKFKKCCGK